MPMQDACTDFHPHSSLVIRETIYGLLQQASRRKDLTASRNVYSLMVIHGLHAVSSLADHIIRIFTACGSLQDANNVFFQLSYPTVYSWNAIISAHIAFSETEKAMELYFKMLQRGMKPDNVSFLYASKACSEIGSVQLGMVIHYHIVSCGLDTEVRVGSSMIDMYAKCGCLVEGYRILSKLPDRNSVSWGVLIAGYTQHGDALSALNVIKDMHEDGLLPDKATLLCLLTACRAVESILHGMRLHGEIIRRGLETDNFLVNSIVNVYAKCRRIDEAQYVFDKSSHKDCVCWIALISGYIQLGKEKSSIELFWEMQSNGILPDRVSFLYVLKASGNIGMMSESLTIHGHIVRYGFDSDLEVQNTIINTYSKCGCLEEASVVFYQFKNRDLITWAALLAGYVQEGSYSHVFELFLLLQLDGINPNNFIFSSVLMACGNARALQKGRMIHLCIITNLNESNMVVANSLIDMYAKCGNLNDAHNVFSNLLSGPDEMSYGALIAGYIQHEREDVALGLLWKMHQQGLSPNDVILTSILKACANMGIIEEGGLMCCHIVENCLQSNVMIASSLADMYVKCGSLCDALSIFKSVKEKDVVLWGVIIAGYAESESASHSFLFYNEMKEHGVTPSKAIFLSILKACSGLKIAEQGRQIHQDISKTGLELDTSVESALLDMYVKCGNLQDAHKLFEGMPDYDVMSWSSIITAYTTVGDWKMAQNCLKYMQQDNLKPDGIIFSNILAACCHGGVLDVGLEYFKHMRNNGGMEPTMLHYSLLVDLIARTGHLTLALQLLQTMPYFPKSFLWTSVLTECTVYGNIRLASECLDESLQLDPNDASCYVLMVNALANACDVVHCEEEATSSEYMDEQIGIFRKSLLIGSIRDHGETTPSRSEQIVTESVHNFNLICRKCATNDLNTVLFCYKNQTSVMPRSLCAH